MLLRPQRLASASYCFFQLYKTIRRPQLNVLKLYRIVSNSGCLVAGCCFSRQSDEDTLLPNVRIETRDRLDSHSNIEQYDTDSRNMKRSFESIHNVIEASEVENADQVADIHNKRKKLSSDETTLDKNVPPNLSDIPSDSFTSTVTEPPKDENSEPPKRVRPNYFVAIKVSNDEIHEKLEKLQEHILEKEDRLKRIVTELKTLHITLMVMYIGDLETHTRAMKALEMIHREHDDDISKNPLQLEFKGLGHFQNRVLFAKMNTNERLLDLVESVNQHFNSAAIYSTDKRKTFTPHLTVAKIDFKKKHNKIIKKIDPELYKEFKDEYFGSQTVESIQLLSMTDPKKEDGYYSGNEIHFSAFDPK